jgi:glycosyltransferase involved in cell wall biosynthesis
MRNAMKLISIVTPCYNEEENVEEVYRQVREVFKKLKKYRYEHLFIDNASTDSTVAKLRALARTDRNIKVIVNARNFGPVRSPNYGLLQAGGDAVVLLVADLQDPPQMIPEMVRQWEGGYKIVVAVKKESGESRSMFAIRKMYYSLVAKLSETELIKNFTGFGLYDKRVIEILRTINDPYPYFRGLICDIGFERATLEYTQPARHRGFTKINFYTLYDVAMLGITNHSKVPLRLAAMLGFLFAVLSLIVAFGYLIYKILLWNEFSLGIAPLVIGFFFFSSLQLFFIGIIGEYIGSIHTQVMKRPMVVEKERINF